MYRVPLFIVKVFYAAQRKRRGNAAYRGATYRGIRNATLHHPPERSLLFFPWAIFASAPLGVQLGTSVSLSEVAFNQVPVSPSSTR